MPSCASKRLSALIWRIGDAVTARGTDAGGGEAHSGGSCNNSNQQQQKVLPKHNHTDVYLHAFKGKATRIFSGPLIAAREFK